MSEKSPEEIMEMIKEGKIPLSIQLQQGKTFIDGIIANSMKEIMNAFESYHKDFLVNLSGLMLSNKNLKEMNEALKTEKASLIIEVEELKRMLKNPSEKPEVVVKVGPTTSE